MRMGGLDVFFRKQRIDQRKYRHGDCCTFGILLSHQRRPGAQTRVEKRLFVFRKASGTGLRLRPRVSQLAALHVQMNH